MLDFLHGQSGIGKKKKVDAGSCLVQLKRRNANAYGICLIAITYIFKK
jgi:hypothetical protein